MALAADAQRSKKVHSLRLTAVPVKGATTVYVGALTAIESATGLAVPASDSAGLVVKGVAHRGFDNSTGADGEITGSNSARYCELDDNGPYSFKFIGTTPRAGQRALVVDDDSLSVDPQVNDVDAGQVVEPDPLTAGNWFVDLER